MSAAASSTPITPRGQIRHGRPPTPPAPQRGYRQSLTLPDGWQNVPNPLPQVVASAAIPVLNLYGNLGNRSRA